MTLRHQKTRSSRRQNRHTGGVWDGLDGVAGVADLEGVAIVVAAAASVLLGWLVVEFVVPALAFAVYVLLLGALRRVANDQHGCEGRLIRSMAWALSWAAIYTVPLAALVYLAHLILASTS